MGGYFIGRPMDPESRPAKTKKASAESRVKSHGLGWRQPTKARVEKEARQKKESKYNPES